jgi:hypothetical protein
MKQTFITKRLLLIIGYLLHGANTTFSKWAWVIRGHQLMLLSLFTPSGDHRHGDDWPIMACL